MGTTRGKSRLLLFLSIFLVFTMAFAACNGNNNANVVEEDTGVVVEEEPVVTEDEGLVEEETGVLEEAETETEEVIEDTEAGAEEVGEEVEAEAEELAEEAETETEELVEEAETGAETAVEETEAETEELIEETEADLDVATLQEGFDVEEGEGIAPIQDVLVGITTLMNFPVDNPGDEDLGEMNDIIIDLNTGNIPYAVLTTGEFLGLGGEDVLVPMDLLYLGENGNELIMPLANTDFEGIPTLQDGWEEGFAADAWDDPAFGFWGGTAWGEDLQDFGEGNMVLWSNIANYGVGDVGTGAGMVSDVLVDLSTNTARWMVLDYGLDGLTLVPFSAFDMEAFGDEFVLSADLDPTALESAPLVARDDLTTGGFYDPTFDDEIITYWEERGLQVEQ